MEKYWSTRKNSYYTLFQALKTQAGYKQLSVQRQVAYLSIQDKNSEEDGGSEKRKQLRMQMAYNDPNNVYF